MFGTKIRSWMEAHIVRPRKKQHRKDAAAKKRSEIGSSKDAVEVTLTHPEVHVSPTAASTVSDSATAVTGRTAKTMLTSEQLRSQYQRQQNSNNLSSPESAYSTGYSTDGTSPGTSFPAVTPAPEYYINIRTGTRYFHSSSTDVPLRLSLPGATPPPQPASIASSAAASTGTESAPGSGYIASPALTSPRQRTRIRTNPWVTTSTGGCNCSPMHVAATPRQPTSSHPQPSTGNTRPPMLAATASPVRRKWSCADKKQRCMKCGACSRFEAFSSSSSSSLSVSSVHRAAARPSVASDDEDDRTLNEMMGKYDESYVYEKETDILSDSDPTDCDEEYDDTDAEAGRDGGDERDPLTDEDDFDFIDNGSLELNVSDDVDGLVNMGHCTYHNFQEEQILNRRRESGKTAGLRRTTGAVGTPTQSRRRRPSERRARHASSKKRRDRHMLTSPFVEKLSTPLVLPLPMPQALPLAALGGRTRVHPGHMDGSRSAGATPVSVRRRRAALSEQTGAWLSRSVDKQRRNSVSHLRRCPRVPPDVKLLELDKEADKKYKELIIEAEHILMAMRTSSPIVGSPARRAPVGPANKRVELLKSEECGGGGGGSSSGGNNVVDVLKSPCLSGVDQGSVKFSPKKNHITNFINHNSPMALVPVAGTGSARGKVPVPVPVSVGSPRRAPLLAFRPAHADLHRHCPQSEPVKRKVYAAVDAVGAEAVLPRPAAANAAAVGLLFTEAKTRDSPLDAARSGLGNPVFQRQMLFHTITSLKKNLENQSETLRHAYHFGSNQRLSFANQHF